MTRTDSISRYINMEPLEQGNLPLCGRFEKRKLRSNTIRLWCLCRHIIRTCHAQPKPAWHERPRSIQCGALTLVAAFPSNKNMHLGRGTPVVRSSSIPTFLFRISTLKTTHPKLAYHLPCKMFGHVFLDGPVSIWKNGGLCFCEVNYDKKSGQCSISMTPTP